MCYNSVPAKTVWLPVRFQCLGKLKSARTVGGFPGKKAQLKNVLPLQASWKTAGSSSRFPQFSMGFAVRIQHESNGRNFSEVLQFSGRNLMKSTVLELPVYIL